MLFMINTLYFLKDWSKVTSIPADCCSHTTNSASQVAQAGKNFLTICHEWIVANLEAEKSPLEVAGEPTGRY
jgi:hypothetical protein